MKLHPSVLLNVVVLIIGVVAVVAAVVAVAVVEEIHLSSSF